VQLDNGQRLLYTGLALCIGARLRTLSLPGAEPDGVLGLKTIDEALRIAAVFRACRAAGMPLVVIGLEVAASATKHGLKVTALEGLSRLMSRVVAPMCRMQPNACTRRMAWICTTMCKSRNYLAAAAGYALCGWPMVASFQPVAWPWVWASSPMIS
jgi:Pyridine nucleotide-disulphide oxidoreductase